MGPSIPKIPYGYALRKSKGPHFQMQRPAGAFLADTSVNITQVLKVSVEHLPQ